jgi:hypothetical protein
LNGNLIKIGDDVRHVDNKDRLMANYQKIPAAPKTTSQQAKNNFNLRADK